MNLGKKASLHLLGDFDFLRGAAFGFELLRQSAALGLDAACQFVESSESESIAVGIAEMGMDSSPCRNLRRELEIDARRLPSVRICG